MMADDWWKNDRVAKPTSTPPAPVQPQENRFWNTDPVLEPMPRPTPSPLPAQLIPTGAVHDGDTFALRGGINARLYGVDAFELSQTGRTRAGGSVPLGRDARTALVPFAKPDATVTPTGASTYGRPVVSLDNGGDAGTALLRQGYGIATPEYLKNDPKRLPAYMEAERDARLNRRGAWAGSFEQPSSYRHGTPDPWAKPEEGKPGDNRTAVFWDDPLPAQGLRPEIADRYISIWQDPASKPDELLAFAKANGFSVNEAEVRRNYAERDKGRPAGGDVRYTSPPRVLTDPGDGLLGASLRGFADPVNVLDEAGAIADTLLPGDRENVWSSDRRFGDIYANNLDQNRSVLAFDDAKHPYARFGGQLVGGLAVPGLSAEGVGFAAARAALRGGAGRFAAEQAARNAVVGRLGVAGAVEGTVAGAGQGETWQDRATGALIGGPVGLTLGAGLGVAAPKLAQMVGRPFSKLAGREGERAATDFTDGAIDAERTRLSNDAASLAEETGPAVSPSERPVAAGAAPAETIGARQEIARPTLYGPEADAAPEAPASIANAIRGEQAASIQASDVLPLPANAVDGIEEAERIAAGRVAPVRAPDERATLERRTIPSATTGAPIAKRGPLDMVSWLRSQGGIRAQGGELEHYGITNAPRQGMDFAGGESRLGPLVANEGMTYDEAALQAWEAGFFPDHVERPTVDEFLDALNATHSGQQRAFRSDDLAEVDAFEAARRQRQDVEGARLAGSPLMEDRGQPIGADDLDAITPPVQAYEEWGENVPNLAGNIRLDKLDSPQSIARALVQTERRAGGFDAATRGRITQAETKNLAADLGMTADDLLKRRKGQAFNAEEALAARQILARSATDLVNIAKRVARVENPGDEVEAAFRSAWLRHAAIQEQVAGMTAEAGRLLAQFRMAADSRDATRALSSLGEGLGGAGRAKEVAERIVDLERVGVSPAGINQFALRSLLPRWKDKAVELYINSLLSGTQTHAVNILSNTLTAIGQLPEHAAAAGIGAVRSFLPGQSQTERVLFSELGTRAVGLVTGAKEGARAAARAFLTGDTVDAVSKVEQQQANAIGGKLGSFIRTPTRLLAAEDELFKGIARRMELNGLAMRQAKTEGLSGAAARDRAAALVLNPPDDMLAKSMDYARYLTFQTPMASDSIAAGISRGTQRQPALKLLLPFVRTPVNLLKFAAERSPAALLMKSWRKEVSAGGARRDLAIARALVGTGFGAAMYEAAVDGKITGGGPADPSARRLLMADGWQPYSLKVGDRYYSYARLDPFSTTIGTVADMVDLQSHMTDKQQERSGTLVVAAILNNLSSKTWLSGLSGALEAVNDPGRYSEGFISRLVGGIVVPSAVAQFARVSDPVLREARGPLDRIRSRIPGMSDDLPARRDVYGREMRSEGGLGPDIASPIWTGTRRNDRTTAALLAEGINLSAPQRTVSGNRLTPEEYSRYSEASGQALKPQLDALVASPDWDWLDDEGKQAAVDKLARAARAQARRGMFANTKRTPWAPPSSDRVIEPARP
ncbi:thermonuclease family protein [Sphingomonas sp. KR1UV-12]|uniref:Thermonuclease family protein n=1 Tax=Sphingomonas aurea TaxID=3063994 RepID=A0ABT9EH26_9SPHN|nr:thermonuclease family protein [Sphingomonas sp. KR1UV-12]MDP1026277.1 thermonuclease family protein [Sphingomonas sp. KR1UV-12]